jgi:hypothetical protein
MVSSSTSDKNVLLTQLIDVYRKLLLMSYTSGLAAPRKYGPDIMDLAGKLAEGVPTGNKLSLLCDELQDVTWKEYVINAKDINYYREKSYRESLPGKDGMLKKLMAVEARWEQELSGEDDDDEGCGRDELSSDGDGSSDDGSGNGVEDEQDEEESGQVVRPEDVMDTSPDFVAALDLTQAANTELTQTGREMGFPYAATAVVAVAVAVAADCLM